MSKEVQPPAKDFEAWAVYNWGNWWGVFRTKQLAIDHAKEMTGKPWNKIRDRFTVAKVKVAVRG